MVNFSLPDSSSVHKPIPVSVLVGFLGSGKTTLLNYLLKAKHNRKIAIVVNEFGEVNIDAKLVRHTTERMIEMSNGCICCTLRDDLRQELIELSKIEGLEYIIIESTGIGEPMPIAQVFHLEEMEPLVRLDSIISVADTSAFWELYAREDTIEDSQGNQVLEALAPLLTDQLEFANIILINKTDIASSQAVQDLTGFVRLLNPQAQIYHTVRGQLNPDLLIDTHLYNYEAAEQTEGWDEAFAKASSEAVEYGFSSFIYKSEKPLRWEAFNRWLEEEWPEAVVRAKGFVVFEDHIPVILSHAGQSLTLQGLLEITTEDEDEDDTGEEQLDEGAEGAATGEISHQHLHEMGMPFTEEELIEEGTELCFIGRGMSKEQIIAGLNSCQALLSGYFSNN